MFRDDPQFAGVWLSPPGANRVQVQHVAFTGDLERHEAEIRARWDGPLCVVRRTHTLKFLRQVQDQAWYFATTIGLHPAYAGTDVIGNRVQIAVTEKDPKQARFDERFGPGVVVATGDAEYATAG